MILDELLGDVPRSAFLERHFHTLPFASPTGAERLAAGWPLVESLLGHPGVDFLAARQGEVWAAGVPAPEQARRLLAEGHTLRFRNAQRHDPGLAALADDFRRAFAGAVDIQVFCTPQGHPGFGWHYDAEDVFVLQAHGSKTWWLRKNTVNPWPLVEALPRDMRYEREIMPAMKCELRAGGWLYVPPGYWHRTEAGEESISLSVGILSPTALDAFDFLRPRLLESLRWRQRLPCPGEASAQGDDELLRRYHAVFADLAADLAGLLEKEQTARDFVAARRAPRSP